MIKITFNTTDKIVKLFSEIDNELPMQTFNNVVTVKSVGTYYVVYCKKDDGTTTPRLKFPINSTLFFIND